MRVRCRYWKQSLFKSIARVVLALAYFAAGYLHIVRPEGFLQITPGWVMWPDHVVFWTGVAEIAGAIGLMVPPKAMRWPRYAAGVGLALYALCVWPANFNHAFANIPLGGTQLSWWYHGPRLAAQPLIIWWALWVGGVTNWPFRAGLKRNN